MGIGSALPPEQRDAVEALLRDTDLTMAAIGARTGVNRHTVCTWNVRAGWLRPPRKSRRPDPARWSAERREALARLYREPRNDPGDLAEAVGVGRAAGRALFIASGLILRPERDPAEPDGAEERLPRAPRDPPPPPDALGPLDASGAADAPTLRAQLRAHIARQIAAFDAALRGEGAAVLDSARVLRDLGGLKRLFDEVAEGSDRGGSGTGEHERERRPEPDPAALRAEIARRYARFVGEPDPG